MRIIKASLLIALTLLVSLPVCCCGFSDSAEKPLVCCHLANESAPANDNVPNSDCGCDDDAFAANSAHNAVNAALQQGLGTEFLPDFLEFAAVAMRDSQHPEFTAPPPPVLAVIAHQNCVRLAVRLV